MGVSEPCTMFSPVLAAHDQYGKGVIVARAWVSFLHLVTSVCRKLVYSSLLLQCSAITLVFIFLCCSYEGATDGQWFIYVRT